MTDRTRPRHAHDRRNVPQRIYDMIVNRKCVHIDAWLYQMPDDEFYFVFKVRLAGLDKYTQSLVAYHASPFGFAPAKYSEEYAARGLRRYATGPWAKRNAPFLVGMHRRDILPQVHAVQAQYVRSSVALHYVYTNKGINDPFEGIENTYNITARGVRAPNEWGTQMDDQPAPKSPWNARERSLLRSLGKLLS